jgi:Na+/H+-dicarboxylate symporter
LVVGIKQLENVSAVGRIGGKALDGFLQPIISIINWIILRNILEPGVGLNLSDVDVNLF